MTDNILTPVLADVIQNGGGGGDGFLLEVAGAKSTVTQILTTDDVAEVIDFAQSQTPSTNITFLTDNQINFAIAGTYLIDASYQVTRQQSTGFVRWYTFWELDTGSGYALIANETLMRSMSSQDSAEIKAISAAPLYLTVTAANTKLRIKHQTDAAQRDVGIESLAAGGIVPNDVPSISISVARLA